MKKLDWLYIQLTLVVGGGGAAAAVVRLAAAAGGGHVLLSWPGGDDLLCFARGYVAMEVSVMC